MGTGPLHSFQGEKRTGYFSVERVSARMLEAVRAENSTQDLSSFKTFPVVRHAHHERN
jgi:hypothetical protein